MHHKMKLKPEEFDNIKYNNKIMEVRLNDDKRKKINQGDRILFYRMPELSQSICVKVKKIFVFKTFKELYTEFPSSYFGYHNVKIDEELSRIYSIYSSRQEEENGVLAILFESEV